MKFKIVRSKFLDGLKSVQNIVAGKGALPILQNVLLEANGKDIKMTTTDLDISIISVAESEVVEAGATTLPVKLLFNAISNVAEGVVVVDVDANNCATITAGSANFKLAGMADKDFPKLPASDESNTYNIPQATLREMMRKVSYAAAQDDTRRTLKGVLMSFKNEKLTMVATDGRRLALVENELEFPKIAEKDIVLPSKTVQEVMRTTVESENVELIVQKTQICFKMEGLTIYSKLIDDVYPNYNQVIPNETAEHIVIDRQLLLSALERAKVMMDQAQSTKLIFSNGKLIVTSAASEKGEAKDEVPIKYAGDTIEIMFNPDYIMDPLRNIDDDEITFNINNGHSPAVIKCSIPFLYVLMPLRVS